MTPGSAVRWLRAAPTQKENEAQIQSCFLQGWHIPFSNRRIINLCSDISLISLFTSLGKIRDHSGHYLHDFGRMSTSTDRKGDKSRRRRTREDNDEQTRDRESTPRGFGHTRAANQNLEELEGRVNQYHLADERNDYEDGDDYGGSNSSEARRSDSSSSWSSWNWTDPKGCWWRSKKDQNGQLIYEYAAKTRGPETETTSSSSRYYTTVRGQESKSSQVPWQPNYTQSSGSSSLREQIRDEASKEYFTGYTSSQNQGSYTEIQPLTDCGPAMNSQDDYSRQKGPFDDENTLVYSSGPTNYENQQITTDISEHDVSARSSPLPPLFIPSPVLCRCELGENLCGVIIFPPQPSPKDGKISSKKSKGKGSSSVSGTKGSGSGSGKLSVKVKMTPSKHRPF